MVGYLASIKVFPHLLDDEGLRVRHGTGVDIHVPWEAVASVGAHRRSVPSRGTVEVQTDEDGTAVSVAVLRQTRIDVVLREPTTLAPAGRPGGGRRACACTRTIRAGSSRRRASACPAAPPARLRRGQPPRPLRASSSRAASDFSRPSGASAARIAGAFVNCTSR